MNATALAPTTPSIRHMADQRMATVRTIGDPGVTGRTATASLYAAVGGGAGLRARWPNAHVASREEWVGLWGLPLPKGEPRSIPGMAPVDVNARQASVEIVKPGGTGSPSEVISARPAPLPPSMSRRVGSPSALPSPNEKTSFMAARTLPRSRPAVPRNALRTAR